ncbi:ankyrin repeat-containing domain protein [Aspergillus heterothallicus]
MPYSLTDLPEELLLIIAEQLSAFDILRFMGTRTTMRRITETAIRSLPFQDEKGEEGIWSVYKWSANCRLRRHAMRTFLPRVVKEAKSDPIIGYSALSLACWANYAYAAQTLVDAGVSVNPLEADGEDRLDADEPLPPLACAMRHRDPKTLQLLLDAGADLNVLTTPRYRVWVSNYLCDRDGEGWFMDRGSETILHILAQTSFTKTMEIVLSQGIDINSRDDSDRTPLMQAAYYGSTASVQVLLAHGAETELIDDHGRTALFCAALTGHSDVTSLLLDMGADSDVRDQWGCSMLHVAARANTIGDTSDHATTAKYLVQHGAQLNLQDCRQRSALILAVMTGQDETAKLLIEHGAQLELIDDCRRTALSYAYARDAFATIKLLIDAGCNQEMMGRWRRSPIDYAPDKKRTLAELEKLRRRDLPQSSRDWKLWSWF